MAHLDDTKPKLKRHLLSSSSYKHLLDCRQILLLLRRKF